MAASAHVRHALFPGTFDPVTLGHLDLARRALTLFGRLTIAVAHNAGKHTFFGPEQRVELLREATRDWAGVAVVLIDGLVVQACRTLSADVIVRGVRSGTDFDYEVQMARTNREMLPEIDTVLLAPSPAHAHISSTLVREIALLGGDASAFVPAHVARALREQRPGRGR
jgi:pantetheine-phosphate adenylyltransferase